MRTSRAGLAFIAREEGIRLRIYLDQVGKPTIGVGHLIRPGEDFSAGLTREQAADLLATDVGRFEADITRYVHVPLGQNQYDALVSLCFNCGAAPLLGGVGRALNQGDYALAGARFLDWRNAGGQPILLGRRQRERAVFDRPDETEERPAGAPDLSAHETTDDPPVYPDPPAIDTRLLLDFTPHRY